MAIITSYALYNSTCGADKPVDDPNNEHQTAQKVGKYVMALGLIGGFIALYALTICAFLNMGPLQHLGLNAKIAIVASLGAIDALTILGLALKALGCGEKKEELQTV